MKFTVIQSLLVKKGEIKWTRVEWLIGVSGCFHCLFQEKIR